MIVVRLLPVILADLLFAAHVMRSFGLIPALIVAVLLVSLAVRKPWLPALWQALLVVYSGFWLHTTVKLARFRIMMDMPWVRLIIIMGAVILFTLFAAYWIKSKKVRGFYSKAE